MTTVAEALTKRHTIGIFLGGARSELAHTAPTNDLCTAAVHSRGSDLVGTAVACSVSLEEPMANQLDPNRRDRYAMFGGYPFH